MINLTEYYDDDVIINGQKYTVNMNFDNILKIYEMLGDKDFSDEEQIIMGNIMLFGHEAATNFDMDLPTLEELFFDVFKAKIDKDGVKEPITDIAGNPMPDTTTEEGGTEDKAMSFKQDADFIYASFMQDYGIDLMEEIGQMHWYKFRALLNGLTEDTKLMKVIEIRTMEVPKGAKAKEKENIAKAKKRYKLKPE